MNLVIVESPAKARTIEKYLGGGYKVIATYGHIRDLPKAELGIDTEHNFKPKYVIPTKCRKTVNKLKKEIEKAKDLYLATDLDREGEAIAWHFIIATKSPEDKIKRITFYEITKDAITKALKNPRKIDMDLVNAQQARRILDRLVGYKISPLLWKKVKRGLSGGRVQSVAVKLIVEREREIEKFTPQEYWTVEALLRKKELGIGNRELVEFKALLTKKNDKKIDKLDIKTEKEAKGIVSDLKGAEYRVEKIEKKEIAKNPKPPFTTSTLQQTASSKLGFSAKKTMVLAQQLYEGINLGPEGSVGLITYMRTDSVNLAKEAILQARNLIGEKFGKKYLPGAPRIYKTKTKGAQEAHEAIRPTYINKDPDGIKEYLNKDQFRLYSLIWMRMLACQMAPALLDSVTCDIKAKNFTFTAKGLSVKFDGFMKVLKEKQKEEILPELQEEEILNLIKLIHEQHFTQPPPRYTEATLVKTLEEDGIGRPSTYAPIMSTILQRGYVEKEGKYFKPKEIGIIVNDLLVEHFPDIFNVKFTACMEKELDEIASGKQKWVPVISDFYIPFEKDLQDKHEKIEKVKLPERKTSEKCKKCGKPMVIKTGRFGEFLACSGFPECKNTKPLIKEVGVKCPQCGGEIIERNTKKGRKFYGCSSYPKCQFALWNMPAKEPCPKCNSLMEIKGKVIMCTKCSYKKTQEND